ncbi:hypothetical protein IFM89_000352 [Coptis chinensis]|uniref:Molybdopterin cofactor biosynthesis C (MoaC) domain-containing protein n=1 Tax=Coptis chinensis TaxID=261450 RepID=A0A835LL05_9MAGN|nr:hypothetical protein IFM89_000352 [Coptis chinensis]
MVVISVTCDDNIYRLADPSAIHEMESVFGEPPSNSNLSPTNDISVVQEPHFIPPQAGENVQGLTHISSSGEAQMIAKGDVLSVARIAGISGAKQISSLIPLCHNISLSHVRVDLTLNEKDFSVEIEREAATTGKTVVEMEAMTACHHSLVLSRYDMCKTASKDIRIMDVCLEHKTGGKGGEWSRIK